MCTVIVITIGLNSVKLTFIPRRRPYLSQRGRAHMTSGSPSEGSGLGPVPDEDILRAVKEIHGLPTKAVIYLAGGGIQVSCRAM